MAEQTMTYAEYCEFIRRHYPRRHTRLYTLREDYFVPSLVRALRAGTPHALRAVCERPYPEVYTFDMLRPEFCATLLDEAEWFEQWCGEVGLPMLRPNTMNNYGAVLDTVGFTPFLRRLMTEYVAPFASLFYPDAGGDSLDSHHGFIVEYKIGKDTSLDFHVDASDVTHNVCLGRQFIGGTLFFRGIRCALHQQTEPLPGESFEITHTAGRAVLHRGRHRHGANPITGGERHNLILWCRSSRFEREHDETRCPAWCGWPEGNE
jgi:hypothetical protein